MQWIFAHLLIKYISESFRFEQSLMGLGPTRKL